MNFTDTSEKGLEDIIFNSLLASRYESGASQDYSREYAVDLIKLRQFLQETQPQIAEAFDIDNESPVCNAFLARLQGAIARRGVIEVLRKGFDHQHAHIALFYGTPTPGNQHAAELYEKNIFSITRQLHYSRDNTQLALDLCIFLNGLPIITFELKNSLTKQTYGDAITQYKRDRDPRDPLFKFGRCAVHFAVDDSQVWMCTELRGQKSWFLPFNKGYNDGAGNPPKEAGIPTDYLWKEILQPASLTEILENYAQIVEEEDDEGNTKRVQIFPRYHQLDVVRALLADAAERGVGNRYLIQHSAGSGKSNSIAWLAHQLVELKKDSETVFDSIIVITDRRILDKQIRETIKHFAQVSKVVGAATKSDELRRFLTVGKKIIITTVQKFPFIYKLIGDDHRSHRFALIIDEAHSSQGGDTMKKMHLTLGERSADGDITHEDVINHIIETRKLLTTASYFAFTATPKNKTLEMFGDPYQEEGKQKFRPFHSYSMKQAIDEGFILDVLKQFTPVQSYYYLIKTIEDDPEFDINRVQKKLRRYVETHEQAIRKKAEIMIDHFHDKVLAVKKIGGEARAMVVTSSIAQAIQYKRAFDAYLLELRSPYKAIVAFSGKHKVAGKQLTEADMNGFPSSKIAKQFRKDPYRFLIVADKFQTGYDEPLLHSMYVDKVLAGVRAVQTLSRLNRAHPKKRDTFVLDFANKSDVIQEAFAPYYRTTILSEATDSNKLHDLKTALDERQVYSQEDVDQFVELFLSGASREDSRFDPILNKCVATYKDELNEDAQVEFKGNAKAFLRTYSFLATVLTFSNAEWEKLSIFLNLLIPKLPAPKEEDLSKGVLEMIDLDSYRSEVKSQISIALPDEDAELAPVPTDGGGHASEQELDFLSNIVREFNEYFGNIEWHDSEKIRKVISEELPAKVADNKAYQNAKKSSDKQNARLEHDRALEDIITGLVSDHTDLFKLFTGNPSFKKWLSDRIFQATYESLSKD